MRVVVVLPFVPDTNTAPSGNCPSVRVRKPGVNLFYDFAGQSRTAMFGDAGCKPHEAACGHGGERIPRFAGLYHGRLVLRNIA